MIHAPQIGRDLLNVPMGDMIRQMAFAIADAQLELDESSIRQAEIMSGRVALRDQDGELILEDGKVQYRESTVVFGYHKEEGNWVDEHVSMMELGFSPTFYQFIDTIIEVKIDIKMTENNSITQQNKGFRRSYSINRYRGGYGVTATVTPVNARHTQTYNYSAEGSSLLKTKLVPVPPPAILEERARVMLEENMADRQAQRAQETIESDA